MTVQAACKPPTLLCKALGCRVNLADMAELLEAALGTGFQLTGDPGEADAAVLFTCTVTHKADADVRKLLSAWRRQRPELPVLVSGCLAKAAPESLAAFDNVVATVAVAERRRLISELRRLAYDRTGPATGAHAAAGAAGVGSVFETLGKHRALLKIQDGCHNRCSYCIVSRVRGPERSMPPAQVTARVERLLAAGHREIVLCGIHLGRYGRQHDTNLAALLGRLAPLFARGQARVRLSSLEPNELDEPLLEAWHTHGWLCPHFHVPVQSGDDGVLSSMGRRYRSEQARAILRRLRREFPQACLGSDLMVGYPGEDEPAFNRTRALVQEGLLDRLHVFTFSPRPGTPAARLPGRPAAKVVRSRARQLRQLGHSHWQRFLSRALGQRLQVLVERTTRDGCHGLSACYRPVTLSGVRLAAGQLVTVEATGIAASGLEGRVVEYRAA